VDESSLDASLSDEASTVLRLLCIIEALNRLTPHLLSSLDGRLGSVRSSSTATPPPGHISRDAFISSRLGPKLSQQMKDVVSICGNTLPPWCAVLTSRARFLFSFEDRRRYFYCTSFGIGRALQFLQQTHAIEHGPGGAADRDATSFRLGRVHRQKVRISRRRILESARRVFELYASAKIQLEVEFFNEAGSGLGPTLEFYTLLSHEFQHRSLGLWRDDVPAAPAFPKRAAVSLTLQQAGGGIGQELCSISGPGPLLGEVAATHLEGSVDSDDDLVSAPQGLFPRPLPPGNCRAESGTAVKHFLLLGRVVAKALQDGRLLDLPLSPVFYRLALGRKVDLYDVRAVDRGLGATLERLAAAHGAAAASGGGPIIVDGCPIEDLCLSFVLPGDSSYDLTPGGSDVAVTSDNLVEYIAAIVNATLGSGVSTQVEAFRRGFSSIFPLTALAPFYEDEVEAMLCGTGEAWTVEGLAEVIKFDHGYSASSAPIVALLHVLAELDPLDQRRFLQFVTGTPRLPPGGLASLQPNLALKTYAEVAWLKST